MESLKRLKKLGLPEKKVEALVGFVNQNDKQVIQKVIECVKVNKTPAINNLETLLNAKQDVADIDKWEKEQRKRSDRASSAGLGVRTSLIA